jgi:hypothetical protein
VAMAFQDQRSQFELVLVVVDQKYSCQAVG